MARKINRHVWHAVTFTVASYVWNSHHELVAQFVRTTVEAVIYGTITGSTHGH